MAQMVWTYFLSAQVQSGPRFCLLKNGDTVPVLGRLLGQDSVSATFTFDERDPLQLVSIDSLGPGPSLVTETPFTRFLQASIDRKYDVKVQEVQKKFATSGRVPAGLDWDLAEPAQSQRALALELLLDEALAPDEVAIVEYELANAYRNLGVEVMMNRGESKDQFFSLSAAHMDRAAQLGHPIALLDAPASKENFDAIWSALVGQMQGDPSGVAGIGAQLAGNEGQIFQSAGLGYVRALALLDLAKSAGIELTPSGIALAELPTEYDVETALNLKLKAMADSGELLTNGVFTLPFTEFSCDGTWCRAPIATYFRFSRPQTLTCTKAGADSASCDTSFRLVMRVDMGDAPGDSTLIDFGNALLSAVGKAAVISARVSMSRSGPSWQVVGPLETY